MTADLLPIGAKAPDFALQQNGGGEIRLSNLLKLNKVVLLNFWTIGCSPCLAELPTFEKMRKRLHPKGLEILAVDVLDPPSDAISLWKRKKFTLKMALDGGQIASEKYHVTACPVTYLIGNNGKVIARYVGYEEAAMRRVLAKTGIR